MQTNAAELRKGLPRKAREELPKNYKNLLRPAHYAQYLSNPQGFSRGVCPDPGKAWRLGFGLGVIPVFNLMAPLQLDYQEFSDGERNQYTQTVNR